MEFKSLKNIESSFRQIRLFGIVFLSLCAVVTVWSVWVSLEPFHKISNSIKYQIIKYLYFFIFNLNIS